MICYRDRTFCAENLCGDPNCSRFPTEEDRRRAAELDLPISYALPCLRPLPEATDAY